MDDETRLFNKLVLDYAYAAATTTDSIERSVAGINQAIAFMHLRNWTAARRILDRIGTEPVAGVAPGAVPFLLAECLSALNEEDEARKNWQAAEKSGGLLTEDGPDIAQRAKERLTVILRR